MLGSIQFELITGLLSFLFTILVLSYLIGDNPGFRLAIHAFAGVSAGYIAVLVFRQVVVDKLFMPLLGSSGSERILLFFPLVMSLMLLAKTSAGVEWIGRPVVALLVGVGTATAIGGAMLGTLIPQVLATTNLFNVNANSTPGNTAGNLLTGVFILAGTVITIAYFQFSLFGKKRTTGKRGILLNMLAVLGQVLISITLGVIFAGVLSASLTALVDRSQSLLLFIQQLFASILM
jgi:hypothetical protein